MVKGSLLHVLSQEGDFWRSNFWHQLLLQKVWEWIKNTLAVTCKVIRMYLEHCDTSKNVQCIDSFQSGSYDSPERISIYQGRMLCVFLGMMRIHTGPSPPAVDNQPALSAGNPRIGIAGCNTTRRHLNYFMFLRNHCDMTPSFAHLGNILCHFGVSFTTTTFFIMNHESFFGQLFRLMTLILMILIVKLGRCLLPFLTFSGPWKVVLGATP